MHAWYPLALTSLRPAARVHVLRGSGLRVTRRVESKGDEASISWALRNTADLALEIGGLGFSMPFNQLFTGRHLAKVAANCSFTEVYLGAGAGYVQVQTVVDQSYSVFAAARRRRGG